MFTAAPGPGVVVGMSDLGDRFRLIAQRDRRRQPERGAAPTARRARGLGAAAQPVDLGRVVAARRRPAPHRPLDRGRHRRVPRPRRDGRGRARRHRRRLHPRGHPPASCAGAPPTTGSPPASDTRPHRPRWRGRQHAYRPRHRHRPATQAAIPGQPSSQRTRTCTPTVTSDERQVHALAELLDRDAEGGADGDRVSAGTHLEDAVVGVDGADARRARSAGRCTPARAWGSRSC